MPVRPPAPATLSRGWFWAQLAIGWTPVWVLYVSMILTFHGGSAHLAGVVAARAVGAAALLGLIVLKATERFPWPRTMHPRFIFGHLIGAFTYALAWMSVAGAVSMEGVRTQGPGIGAFVFMGVWLYVAVAGVSYASNATERAARAEALAAQSQLAALRSKLDPHFLFNALHTVVQLIPVEPARAADAAELLAALLRTVTEEDRDVVPLRDERAFIERYLALEQLRFGERLLTRFDIAPGLEDALVPPFALQTLVENAVRHGAAPRVETTSLKVGAVASANALVLTVADTGVGAAPEAIANGGTGLRRLRERLDALHGSKASLTTRTSPGAGFIAVLSLPLEREAD